MANQTNATLAALANKKKADEKAAEQKATEQNPADTAAGDPRTAQAITEAATKSKELPSANTAEKPDEGQRISQAANAAAGSGENVEDAVTEVKEQVKQEEANKPVPPEKQQQDNSAQIAEAAQVSATLPSANQMSDGMENSTNAATIAQIQAQIAAEKQDVLASANRDTVRFAAFRNVMRNVNQMVAGQTVSFFNHEAYIQVSKKNESLISKLKDMAEDYPELGITVADPAFVDVNPAELEQQRKAMELNLFLADKRRRQAPVNTEPDRFRASSTTGMKGENTGSLRFTNVESK